MRSPEQGLMAARTVDPATVKTLRDWAARWPKVGNLGFDAETREPTIYSRDTGRSKVATIPWEREGDVLTILTQPAGFSEGARTAAGRRYDLWREKQATTAAAGVEQLRAAETALLDAWRAYRGAEGGERAPLLRAVVSAEQALREVESGLADVLKRGRTAIRTEAGTRVQIPVIPLEARVMPLATAE
jgi:hypothetical protein